MQIPRPTKINMMKMAKVLTEFQFPEALLNLCINNGKLLGELPGSSLYHFYIHGMKQRPVLRLGLKQALFLILR